METIIEIVYHSNFKFKNIKAKKKKKKKKKKKEKDIHKLNILAVP